MKPILFEIPSLGLAFSSYFIMLLLAFIVTFYLSLRYMKRDGLPAGRCADALIVIIISVLVGSRIAYVLENSGLFGNPVIETLKFWEGGYVFYGGFILAAVAGIAYLKIRKVPVMRFLDCLAAPLGLGTAIGRIGCLLNGCCYGNVSYLPWAVVFPAGSQPFSGQVQSGLIRAAAGYSLPLHPTQLYLSLSGILIFMAVRIVNENKKFEGLAWWCFVMLYAALRFIIEFYRGDHELFIWGLSLPQIISAAAVIIAGIAYYACSRRSTQ